MRRKSSGGVANAISRIGMTFSNAPRPVSKKRKRTRLFRVAKRGWLY